MGKNLGKTLEVLLFVALGIVTIAALVSALEFCSHEENSKTCKDIVEAFADAAEAFGD